MGRLVGVVADRGPTATATSLYRYDAADNRNYVGVAKADGTKIPIFRFFKNPNRFYTTDYMEGSELGFDPEQLAFSLYPSSGSGLVGLYRCYASANAAYFITTASNCEGQTVQGLMGYAYTTAGTGRRALYRFYKASTADHLVTVSYDEGNNNGYTLVSTLGYVI
ncbi:hypothetical protein ASE85_04675 [Sphingobium sp. Leaf26]|nr:hypothetical protein ASE85_04675 [Sphingobium sp. Leaf26]